MSRKPLSVQAQQDRLRRKRREAGEVLTIFRKPLKESLTSVLPITAIVLVLCFTITPISNNAMMAFLLGSLLLIVGMGLFTLGSEMSMIPLGEAVGKEITKSKKVWVIVAISFLIGVIITVAEPDLQVLAGQVPSIPDRVIIWSVALGVGVFLVIALLRILFAIQLSYLLIGFYAIVFVLAGFVSPDFWAVAFDSGGVTTGPMTVPFIMALGVGVSAVRNDKDAGGDSFGLVALCSIGPIITVLLLGLLYQPDGSTYTPVSVPDAKDTAEMFRSYTHALPEYFKEIFLSLAPILAFFVLFQLVTRRMHRREVMSMLFGLLYTYIGLVLFLTGVNVGFMPVGSFLGEIQSNMNVNAFDISNGGNVEIRFPKDITFLCDYDYNFKTGYTDGFDRPQHILGIQLNVSVFKKKQGTISLKGFDLLNQRRIVSRIVRSNYIEDLTYNTQPRYFMLQFSYRFNYFARQK